VKRGPAKFGLSEIGQITVNVRDIKKATAFYQNILGIRYLFGAPNMAFFDCGGVRLMLGVAEKPEFDHPASIIYYKVDDIHDAHAILVSRSVKFESEPHLVARMPDHELWMAFFRDIDDNFLVLMSEIKK
jgi:methylmalonyl-CoA/ethylmalonyl-CoA epimerase